MNFRSPSLIRCTVDIETEICTHGCNVEWRIHDFERGLSLLYPMEPLSQNSLTSKDIKPQDCDISWQLYLYLDPKYMRVGFQLSDGNMDDLKFNVEVQITIQNTSGDVLCNETLKRQSFPQCFQIERPWLLRSQCIPKSSKKWRLGGDDVLVVKAVIVSKGCCAKDRNFQYKPEDV